MGQEKGSAQKTINTIRRKTQRKHASEEKIRVVLEGLRGEVSVAELCRREGIAESLYYKWAKDFLEAGKARLAGDTQCSDCTASGGLDESLIEPQTLPIAMIEFLHSISFPQQKVIARLSTG